MKLQKLQAASNTANPPGIEVVAGSGGGGGPVSFSSSVSTSSSTMITGAVPKDKYDESGEETEEENEVIDESPEGRWIKQNKPVSQRDVPGIEKAYLAMDTEYGIEVVWNEILLSGNKKLKSAEVAPFCQLTLSVNFFFV